MSNINYLLSSGGGSQVLTVGTLAAKSFTTVNCRAAMVWTVSSAVYIDIGTAATTVSPLMPSNLVMPFPFTDISRLSFYNAGGTDATINLLWRT